MPKTKWMPIEGSVEVPAEMTFDEFCDKFIDAMGVLGWKFFGFFGDVDAEVEK